MKKLAASLFCVAALASAGDARAEYGTIDVVPAATLLLPYFEVDLDNEDGVTTLFSVNNASASAAVAHVVFWTDWSQHALDFNIYLTGYDVQTINIRDIFADGFLPVTGDAGSDPSDTISPQGAISQDINFPGAVGPCAQPYENPAVTGFNLDLIRLGHTGKPIPDFGNRCIGENNGDNVARGYVTVDTVTQCTLLFPGDPGYFTGIIDYRNLLWGDFFIVDAANNFAFGDNLVHVEAEFSTAPTPTNPQGTTGYTFYGRYTFPAGSDYREPLGTVWATRFLNGGGFNGGTDLIAWRDSTANNQPANGFSCAVGPNWRPLNQAQIVIFDEQENPVAPEGCDISPCSPEEGLIPFPLETQRVHVGGPSFAVPYDFGWLYLNLNFLGPDAPTGDVDFNLLGTGTQSYVISSHSAEGRFQVGYPAVLLRHALTDLFGGEFLPVFPD